MVALLATTYEVQRALTLLKVKKAFGPDCIPNLLLKTFVFELAPVVCELYNASLLGGYMPPFLKTASVRPLSKQNPAKSVGRDIRPVSLISQVSKVLEGLSLTKLQASMLEKMDCRQFAVAGRSSEQATVYLLHLALEALDRGGCASGFYRFSFADFRKAFDLIDNHILLQKLSKFNIHAALLRWVAAFLQGRTQVTRIGDRASSLRSLHGGIPQRTKLGPILFSVMVKDLVSTWATRAKFVDDFTVLEIIPRNFPALLGYVIKDVQSYDCNMRLNPARCKEMSISFLLYDSCVWQPISIVGLAVSRVESFKLLGVHVSQDLTWAVHFDAVIKKANGRLYAIRALKKSGFATEDLVLVAR